MKRKPKLTPQHPDPRLQYVYTDKLGHNYFEFTNDASMPFKRYTDAQVTEKLARLGFSKSGLEEIIAVCEAQALDATRTAEQLRADIFTIGANLKSRLGFLTNKRTYEQYASVFYLIDDEPLEPSDRWYLKKIDLWSQDEAARDFFLLGSFRKLTGFVTASVQDMMLSLKAMELREEKIPTLPKK